MTPASSLLDPASNPALYTSAVLTLYVELPDTPLRASIQDQRLAHRLFETGVPLSLVETALLLGSLRRLCRPSDVRPLLRVRSLAYFQPIIEELQEHPAPHSGTGRNNQGAFRSGKRGAERLNRTPVLLAIRCEVGKVVIKGGVDHAVRPSGRASQTLQVFKIPSMHLSAGGHESPGTLIGTRHSEHLMTGVDELRHDGGTDKACSPGDKNTHAVFSLRPVRVVNP
jgi:hypothetical protein